MNQYSEELVEKLRNRFYVENCVTRVPDVSELDIFIKAATEIMKEAKFDLIGWEQTEIPACLSSNSMSQVLGLIWNKNSDTLEIDFEALKYDKTVKITKRKMLSIISSMQWRTGQVASVPDGKWAHLHMRQYGPQNVCV
ncbi:hypothetical protein AVEN_72058-1 [Araneus ventricosus]|uniref:Uncharacterized protein n=1 Tax=Araneus ventricosus TaxID=182803 RepID=A0A4Y2PT68_ARAVE|nr:hypothetical protein AVEN_72058-1 [Araneus ventricosus]